MGQWERRWVKRVYGGWTHLGLTLRAENPPPVGKLSSEHPRCCTVEMQTFLRLECSNADSEWIVVNYAARWIHCPAAVRPLNRSNDLSVRATRALMAEEGGAERGREREREERRRESCVASERGGPRGSTAAAVCLHENTGSWDRCLSNQVREMSRARMEPIHPWQRNYRFAPLLSSVLPRHALPVHGSSRINCLWKSGLTRSDRFFLG